ncbi:MAG: hypothetical protein OJF50_002482 [Nitrospira sp.]|nr:hypothetical protein [Nitrospira sp.]
MTFWKLVGACMVAIVILLWIWVAIWYIDCNYVQDGCRMYMDWSQFHWSMRQEGA